jgi:hypothetical protein
MFALLVLADTAAERAGNIPEPIVAETVTDIDGTTGGEVEFDLTGYATSHVQSASLEVEWRVFSRLGVELEAGLGDESSGWDGDLRLGASVPLVHYRGFHLMLEGGARVLDRGTEQEPGEFALPYFAGARVGERFGIVTLRAGLDAELGGGGARVPLAGDLAVLVEYGPHRRGFAGVEGLVDGAAALPVTIIPEITYLFGTRLRLGVAVPIGDDPSSGSTSVGILLRATLELEDDDD